MRRIEDLQLSLIRQWCCVVLVAFFGVTACDRNEGAARSSKSHTPTAPGRVEEAVEPTADAANCEPKCGATCGIDNGCDGTCGCSEGEDCKQGVCVDPACGPCRPNERCESGQCQCVPNCEERDCRPDGCGATCPCPPGMGVNAQGNTVPLDQCKDTCDGSSFQCGALCGADCGSCGEGETCKSGSCACAPQCDGTSCTDGCGGTCPCAGETVCNAATLCTDRANCTDTCESAARTCGSICGADCGSCGDDQACIDGQCREGVSCSGCALQLRLVDRSVVAGKIVRVKLAVDVTAADDSSGPRLMDLRVVADKLVELVDAVAGPALLKTGKDLFVDETTRQPWQQRGDQSYQLLAYSLSGTMRVVSGRAITLTFDLAEPGPVRFSFVRHAQTFAPLDVDNVLQASTYDDPLAVSQ